MFYKLSIILLFTAGSQLGCSRISEAQTRQDSNNYAVAKEISSSDELKVKIDVDSLILIDSRLETILTQPAPAISLFFSCRMPEFEKDKKCNQDNLRAGISLDEQQTLQKYWKQSVSFKYKYLIQKFPNANEEYKESNRFSVMTNQFLENLKDSYINSPSGKRRISNSEAEEIMKSVNIAAVDVIEKLRILKTSQNSDEVSTPSRRVKEFMRYVQLKEFDKAKTYQTEVQIKKVKKKPKSSDGIPIQTVLPPQFNWGAMLGERDLVLEKVLDEKTVDDKSIVKTELRGENYEKIRLFYAFHLEKSDSQWYISDIDFLTRREALQDN